MRRNSGGNTTTTATNATPSSSSSFGTFLRAPRRLSLPVGLVRSSMAGEIQSNTKNNNTSNNHHNEATIHGDQRDQRLYGVTQDRSGQQQQQQQDTVLLSSRQTTTTTTPVPTTATLNDNTNIHQKDVDERVFLDLFVQLLQHVEEEEQVEEVEDNRVVPKLPPFNKWSKQMLFGLLETIKALAAY